MTKLLLTTLLATLPALFFADSVVPNYPLVNQKGKPFQLYDLKGAPVLLSFIFTRCPQSKMCPLTVTLNKSVLRELKKQKDSPKLQFLLVTLDPDHDSSKILDSFAKARDLDTRFFTLATGNSNSLSDFASQFNVIGFPSSDSGMISHNVKTILLDRDLKPVKEFKDNEWSAKDVLKELLTESRKTS